MTAPRASNDPRDHEARKVHHVELSPEQIERLNAHGPYNHAVWSAKGITVSNEEKLSGRGRFLVQSVRAALEREFTHEQMAQMSIADVGCYDGWVLHELSDLPFARMVGIEPREKNLLKGKVVRETLGVRTRVEFQVGEIESLSLSSEQFDVVLCLGLLHHLESIPLALRNLRAVCRRFLYLETICLSSRHINDGLRREMELKDVVYFGRATVLGLTGQKLESAYYDGSTTTLTAVSIPSAETLRMYLQVIGFDQIRTEVDPERFRDLIWRDQRDATAICISARPADPLKAATSINEAELVANYERGLARTLLGRQDVERLVRIVHNRAPLTSLTPFGWLVVLYLHAPSWLAGLPRRLAAQWLRDRYAREILKNLRFNTADKVTLEWGKVLYAEGDYAGAIEALTSITQRLNADSRATYRSFYLLARAHQALGNEAASARYLDLCLTCNPKYPLDAIEPAVGLRSTPPL